MNIMRNMNKRRGRTFQAIVWFAALSASPAWAEGPSPTGLRLTDNGKTLSVRGYIGVPMLGRSQTRMRQE